MATAEHGSSCIRGSSNGTIALLPFWYWTTEKAPWSVEGDSWHSTPQGCFRHPPFPKPWHACRRGGRGLAGTPAIYIESSYHTTAASKLSSLPHGLKLVSVRVLLDRRRTSGKPAPDSRPGGLYPLSSMITQGRRASTRKEVAMAIYEGGAFEVHHGRRSSSCK